MLKLKVPDMTCGHCISTVEKAVKAVDATAVVKTDLGTKIITVETSAAPEAISKAIDGAGYPNTVA